MIPSSSYFFELAQYEHKALFGDNTPPWGALQRLVDYLKSKPLGILEGTISPSAYLVNPELISIGAGSVVEPGAYIQGPCIIGKHCVVRHGAYIRGNIITGDHCVIGHDTEVKHSIFLNGAHAAHFAYVGDSILGNKVNLGAGLICANLRLDDKPVTLQFEEERVATGMRKFGAIIGDKSQLGCNIVSNPGTVIGQEVRCYPCLNIHGFIPSRSLVKTRQELIISSY